MRPENEESLERKLQKTESRCLGQPMLNYSKELLEQRIGLMQKVTCSIMHNLHTYMDLT